MNNSTFSQHASLMFPLSRRRESVTCEVQRCRVASLRIPTVDVVGATQFLHPGQATLLSGVQQRGISPQQVLDVGVPVLHQVQGCVPVPVLLGRVRPVLETRRHNGG